MASAIIERKTFRVTIIEPGADGEVSVRVEGKIQEDLDSATIREISDCLSAFPDARVDFHLSQVKSINSVGIRSWLLLMEELEQLRPFQFIEINEIFVESALLIPGLLGTNGQKVLSVLLPYHCQACAKDFELRGSASELRESNGKYKLPPRTCESCGQPLEFGAVEEEYSSLMRAHA